MYCKHCGWEIKNEDASFCPNCGQRLASKVEETILVSLEPTGFCGFYGGQCGQRTAFASRRVFGALDCV